MPCPCRTSCQQVHRMSRAPCDLQGLRDKLCVTGLSKHVVEANVLVHDTVAQTPPEEWNVVGIALRAFRRHQHLRPRQRSILNTPPCLPTCESHTKKVRDAKETAER